MTIKCFYYHLKNLRINVKFTTDVEPNDSLHFPNVLFITKGASLVTTVHTKPKHTGNNLHYASNHAFHIKIGGYTKKPRLKVQHVVSKQTGQLGRTG